MICGSEAMLKDACKLLDAAASRSARARASRATT
jgi:hypothetical protein